MKIRDTTGIDDLIRASEAARLLGITPRTLANWSARGILPEPVRVGPGERRFYYRRDIDALLRNEANAAFEALHVGDFQVVMSFVGDGNE